MSTDAPPAVAPTPEARAVAFVDRWTRSSGAERSNYQMFLSELCDLLDVPRPDPATGVAASDVYVFDKPVAFRHPDGTSTTGFADLYHRGHFVCETGQGARGLSSRCSADRLTTTFVADAL